MSMIIKYLKGSISRALSVIIIYKEGKMVENRVFASLAFAPYLNDVTLDYLYVF